MNKKMMREDDDVENMGIMQGFMDSMAEDDDENEGDDEGDPEMMMDRRPDTPEILMNNLRGDMRSVSARRDELADLVGYQAATETPDSVLAMLQPVLAQQGGGGIGALPQSQDMAQGPQPPMMGGAPGMPPPGMPPMPPGAGMPPPPQQGGIAELMAGMGGGAPGGGMPPPPQQGGMPPGGQPPIAMARGGYVQNFSRGSNENGVTPAEGTAVPDDLMMFPPDVVAAAKKSSMDLFNQKAAPTPTLSGAMAARLPEYTKLLGADRGASEAQMLFDLGQRAFGFAANVDDSGRPLRGSFMSRLAGATRTLPAAMGKRIDEIGKIDRQLKVLALQQGEKDIDQVTAQNAALQKRKGDLINQVLTAQSRIDAKKAGEKPAGPLGKGSKGDILNYITQYAPLYAAGSLEPEQRNAFVMAVTDYTQPSSVEFTDPLTQAKSVRTQRNELPPFVMEALGNKLPGMPTSSAVTAPAAGSTAPVRPPAEALPGAPTSAFLGLTPNNTNPDTYQVASTAPKTTFFDFAGTGTGFVPVMVAGVARNVPVDAVGKIGPEFQQSTAMLTSMSNRIVNALQENPRFVEGERVMIKKELDIEPRLLSNKNAYINQIIALDNVFEGIENKTYSVLNEPKTGITSRNEAAKKLEEIGAVREMLGIQQRTFLPTAPNYNSDEDRRKWAALPPGQYIVLNPQGFKEVREKKPAAKR
jgi:hypothetical protein